MMVNSNMAHHLSELPIFTMEKNLNLRLIRVLNRALKVILGVLHLVIRALIKGLSP